MPVGGLGVLTVEDHGCTPVYPRSRVTDHVDAARYHGRVKIIAFVVALVLFLGGMALFAVSFQAVGFEGLVFFAGIIAITLALAIPVHLLKRID